MMILSKEIELWYKGELVKSYNLLNNGRTESWYRQQWKKEYGKKFDSPEVEVKIIIQESVCHQTTERKSTTPFAAMIKRTQKPKFSSHYTENNHWR